MRIVNILALATLLSPVCGFAASKEQMEMQRDIAQLQEQVRTLQSGFDQKMAAVQAVLQQAVDAGNKANTGVSVLSASVSQTIDRVLAERLTPVAGLAAKVDNLTSDSAELKNSLGDLSAQVNKMMQLLADLNNAVKIIQAPPAAPPPAQGGFGGPSTSTAPPASASTIYGMARGDYSSGHTEVAAGEFADFLKMYPDDPMAPDAQMTIGMIHYSQGKYDVAVTDFDAVLERYPDNKTSTPNAYFMKGMALKAGDHRDKAAIEFKALIKKFPLSDEAKAAKQQLSALGLSAAPAPAPARKRAQ